MSTLYITDGKRNDRQESIGNRGRDLLKADALNEIPGPIIARFIGGDTWPVIEFEVESAIVLIDVCGRSQAMSFCEITHMTDIEGNQYDPETFWTDYD